MWALVDGNECIGCGSCEAVCEDIFAMDDSGIAQVKAETTDETKECTEEAMDICPVKCIHWDED